MPGCIVNKTSERRKKETYGPRDARNRFALCGRRAPENSYFEFRTAGLLPHNDAAMAAACPIAARRGPPWEDWRAAIGRRARALRQIWRARHRRSRERLSIVAIVPGRRRTRREGIRDITAIGATDRSVCVVPADGELFGSRPRGDNVDLELHQRASGHFMRNLSVTSASGLRQSARLYSPLVKQAIMCAFAQSVSGAAGRSDHKESKPIKICYPGT
ncbi:unnamed protein product, partial [Iphiclides podalirius]